VIGTVLLISSYSWSCESSVM